MAQSRGLRSKYKMPESQNWLKRIFFLILGDAYRILRGYLDKGQKITGHYSFIFATYCLNSHTPILPYFLGYLSEEMYIRA